MASPAIILIADGNRASRQAYEPALLLALAAIPFEQRPINVDLQQIQRPADLVAVSPLRRGAGARRRGGIARAVECNSAPPRAARGRRLTRGCTAR
jgi:hypothetical protein